jgi:type II secretory pathway predicted ATPase ExeA
MVEGAPPYAPGFGIVPPVAVGRDELLDRHAAALQRGPIDPYFTQAVTGERGVGKTVFLRMLGERMTAAGWAVVHYQGRDDRHAVADLLELLPEAIRDRWQGRAWRSLERELSVEVNAAVVKVRGRVTAPAERPAAAPTVALQRALRRVAERAAKQNVGILICVDEAQALGVSGLGELGMIAQTVAHGERLPVAFAFSGTPELEALLLRSGSFLERMARTELGMLSRDEARLALIEPAAGRGARFDDDALELLVAAAGGYPYFVQLGGYHAWEAASGRDAIGRDAAAVAAATIQRDADRMFRDRWARLGPTQRQYLAAAALLVLSDPPMQLTGVPTGQIAAALGRQHTQLSTARASLIKEHHLLRSDARGRVQFAIPRFRTWLEQKLASREGDSSDEFKRYAPDRPDARAALP